LKEFQAEALVEQAGAIWSSHNHGMREQGDAGLEFLKAPINGATADQIRRRRSKSQPHRKNEHHLYKPHYMQGRGQQPGPHGYNAGQHQQYLHQWQNIRQSGQPNFHAGGAIGGHPMNLGQGRGFPSFLQLQQHQQFQERQPFGGAFLQMAMQQQHRFNPFHHNRFTPPIPRQYGAHGAANQQQQEQPLGQPNLPALGNPGVQYPPGMMKGMYGNKQQFIQSNQHQAERFRAQVNTAVDVDNFSVDGDPLFSPKEQTPSNVRPIAKQSLPPGLQQKGPGISGGNPFAGKMPPPTSPSFKYSKLPVLGGYSANGMPPPAPPDPPQPPASAAGHNSVGLGGGSLASKIMDTAPNYQTTKLAASFGWKAPAAGAGVGPAAMSTTPQGAIRKQASALGMDPKFLPAMPGSKSASAPAFIELDQSKSGATDVNLADKLYGMTQREEYKAVPLITSHHAREQDLRFREMAIQDRLSKISTKIKARRPPKPVIYAHERYAVARGEDGAQASAAQISSETSAGAVGFGNDYNMVLLQTAANMRQMNHALPQGFPSPVPMQGFPSAVHTQGFPSAHSMPPLSSLAGSLGGAALDGHYHPADPAAAAMRPPQPYGSRPAAMARPPTPMSPPAFDGGNMALGGDGGPPLPVNPETSGFGRPMHHHGAPKNVAVGIPAEYSVTKQ
jgi:hypothetical protein